MSAAVNGERRLTPLPALALLLLTQAASADREPVLPQIDVPHSYYYREMYLPQFTRGPSSLAWSPDGQALIYSMQGSLWRQALKSERAVQLTAGPGYDYLPDWSPDGKRFVFSRYDGKALELYLLELSSSRAVQLTNEGAVNLDARWAPAGKRIAFVSTRDTGRFHIRIGELSAGELTSERFLPERQNAAPRYYYSPVDHELSPAWSPDGKALIYVSNEEAHYGTGDIVRRGLEEGSQPVLIRSEETTWKARPDWSPDGKRVIYSSYLGRQWHQLWVTTAAGGGDPLPLSYGQHDITHARWSPDGSRIAYISNETGDTSIWIQDVVSGRRSMLRITGREFLHPTGRVRVIVKGEDGKPAAARVSVTDAAGRHYVPYDAWAHADDGFDRSKRASEIIYFHTGGDIAVTVPAGATKVTVWRGLEHHIAKRSIEVRAGETAELTVTPEPLELPVGWTRQWLSGDVHVHMNYGGAYRNTPARLVEQAAAEDLDVVHNLIVNKEQRIPDIEYFSTKPDPASTDDVLLMHGQEYHTSFWGHVGLLGLQEYFLLPDYAAYPNTGAASLYPSNNVVADLARAQQALVGYVHPFEHAPDPEADTKLTHALPVDAALGKVDYYEVLGFSDPLASASIWHGLLNCGARIAAAGGSDTMANFASLRGPVGINRVYVRTPDGPDDPRAARWLAGLKAGHTMATNGPLLSLEVDGKLPGEVIQIGAPGAELKYAGFLRSIVPVDHLEVIMNGDVVATLAMTDDGRRADFEGAVSIERSGWLLVRAWNDESSDEIFDSYPYATTSPVYIEVAGQPGRSPADGEYFLRWLDRVREAAAVHPDYLNAKEKRAVLAAIDRARPFYETCRR